MQETKVVFSQDEKFVWLDFSNGEQSPKWDTKEKAIEAFFGYIGTNQITLEEAKTFATKILSSKLSGSLDSVKIIAKDVLKELEPIQKPIFKMCNCRAIHLHGYIYNEKDEVRSSEIDSKEQGLKLIEVLVKGKLITENDAVTLHKTILFSKLPDFASPVN